MAIDAVTRIELPVTRTEMRSGNVDRLILLLETSRPAFGGGVRSSARAGWLATDRIVSFAAGVKGDFRKILLYDASARATQKKLDTQHASVFTMSVVDELKKEVTDFYKQVQLNFYTYKFAG